MTKKQEADKFKFFYISYGMFLFKEGRSIFPRSFVFVNPDSSRVWNLSLNNFFQNNIFSVVSKTRPRMAARAGKVNKKRPIFIFGFKYDLWMNVYVNVKLQVRNWIFHFEYLKIPNFPTNSPKVYSQNWNQKKNLILNK